MKGSPPDGKNIVVVELRCIAVKPHSSNLSRSTCSYRLALFHCVICARNFHIALFLSHIALFLSLVLCHIKVILVPVVRFKLAQVCVMTLHVVLFVLSCSTIVHSFWAHIHSGALW